MNRHAAIRCLWLALAGTVLLRTPAAATPTDAQIARDADTYLQAHADAGSFSGTVLVARSGKVLFVKGYGFADEQRQLRNGRATRFPIASITKTFTATLVLQLQHSRLLSIDDPVCRHLAPCPAHWNAITLRHLLMHTAGIPDYAKDADFEQKRRLSRTRDQIIAGFRDRPLQFAPGARYSYSNSSYLVLAAVLERAGGKRYRRLLEERILAPLGMRDSGLEPTPASVPLARGYRPDGASNAPADPVDPAWLDAAGAMYSTVDDLLRWDRALAAGSLLPREVLAAMWSPALRKYGLGWQLEPPAAPLNRRLVFHAGGTTGFSSDFLRYPDEQVAIVVLANLMPVPLADVSRDLAAIVFGEKYSLPTVRHALAVDPSIYDAYAGRYRLAPEIHIVVSRDGDRLIVQATGQSADVAIPDSATTFFSRVSPVRLSFVKDGAGKVVRLVLHQPGRDLVAPRIAD